MNNKGNRECHAKRRMLENKVLYMTEFEKIETYLYSHIGVCEKEIKTAKTEIELLIGRAKLKKFKDKLDMLQDLQEESNNHFRRLGYVD